MNVTLDRLVEFIGNHWIMASGLFVVGLLLVQDLVDSATRKYKAVTPTQAVTLMNDDSTVVVDVREPNEYTEGHIEGSRNIPLAKLDERAHELEDYKQNTLIVTCQSGTRSALACKKLAALGFAQVFEMRGGMLSWGDQKLPVSKKRGKK